MKLPLLLRLLTAISLFVSVYFDAFSQEKANNNNIVLESDIESPITNVSDFSDKLIKNRKGKQRGGKDLSSTGETSKRTLDLINEEIGSELSDQAEIKEASKTLKSFQRIIDPEIKLNDKLSEVSDLPVNQIYSKKDWMKFKDSLEAFDRVSKAYSEINNLNGKKLGEEDILDFVNRRSGESISQIARSDHESKLEQIPSSISSIDVLQSASNQLPNLNNLEPELFSLPQFPSSIISSDFLPVIEKVRKANLKGMKLDNQEIFSTENSKISKFKDRAKFLDKYTSDIVAGLFLGEEMKFYFSPALSYKFNNLWSLGIGPSFMITYIQNSALSTVGVRSFVRKDLFNEKLYIQLENQLADSHFNVSEIEKIKLVSQRNLLGAGYLLKYNTKYSLNFGLFLHLSGSSEDLNSQNFLLRIGISSIK